jgi:MFS family permease
MYGRKRMYNVGFVVFIVGSALCGFATSGLVLVGFRAVQGVGAALLAANSFALLSEAFPRNERGRAFGANSIVWGSGTILGIILGGLIITYTSWRLIFLINVPIGIFGTFWAYKTLRATENNTRKQSFDLPATSAFTLGLLALLLGVTWGIIYSWRNLITLVSLFVSPFFFLFFAYWGTKRSKDPVIDFSFFRNRVFTLSILTATVQSLALFSVNFLPIFYLEGIAGLDVLTASYLIIPMAVASSVIGPFAGMLSDRFGARILASIGLLVQMIVLFVLSRLTTNTTLLQVGIVEAFYGAGSGLFRPANTSAIMASSPPESYGVASGIMNTFRYSGMVMSFALALTVLTGVIPTPVIYQLFIGTFSGTLAPDYAAAYLGGQSFAFELSAGLLVFAAVLPLARGREARHVPLTRAGSPPITPGKSTNLVQISLLTPLDAQT